MGSTGDPFQGLVLARAWRFAGRFSSFFSKEIGSLRKTGASVSLSAVPYAAPQTSQGSLTLSWQASPCGEV